MASGSKRLPRAVREQQMLDAAVEVFSDNGYHGTSMDAIAARAQISKPMLYLYYNSKEELFAACIRRDAGAFAEALAPAGDPGLTPREQVQAALVGFLTFVDTHRRSWMVLYRQAIGQQAFASEVRTTRERLIALAAALLAAGSRVPMTDREAHLTAVALVGAGEAVADRVAGGEIDVADALDVLMDMAWYGLAGRKPAEAHEPTA
ncbi:TetR/AcrR family transcriptional regulator [Millisia brevis]|uniref:TetR/AcrR family transcriptional regulator n=1 Tax=Millisia brevis TaxID=264148 RepID=UPI000837A19F|nr:TetR/AcrR family transcriptional regulator [Millisia brevis]